MKILKFGIVCGDKTCASEPGKFCNFCGTIKFGTRYRCHVFGKELKDKDGWLQRCEECIYAEKNIYEGSNEDEY